VRLITIPNGFRLRLLELLANIGLARLPDEWLHMKAAIRSEAGNVRLTIDGVKSGISSEAFPIEPLMASQYQTLASCRGRLLRARIVSVFRQWLPGDVVKHRPLILPRARGVGREVAQVQSRGTGFIPPRGVV
jgi:hypothetical protein